jgi:hypothetical protein
MKTNHHEQKINKKENTRKWIVRIFALLLALLLVSGTFYYLFVFIASLLA